MLVLLLMSDADMDPFFFTTTTSAIIIINYIIIQDFLMCCVCVCGYHYVNVHMCTCFMHIMLFHFFLIFLISCVSSDSSWQLCYHGNLLNSSCEPWAYRNQWDSVVVRVNFTNEKRNDIVTTVFPSMRVREHGRLYLLV